MFVFQIFIFFAVEIVLYLSKRATLHNEETETASCSTEPEEEFEDNSEFDTEDWDREVDEMPDDSLIYGDLFNEE